MGVFAIFAKTRMKWRETGCILLHLPVAGHFRLYAGAYSLLQAIAGKCRRMQPVSGHFIRVFAKVAKTPWGRTPRSSSLILAHPRSPLLAHPRSSSLFPWVRFLPSARFGRFLHFLGDFASVWASFHENLTARSQSFPELA